MCCNSAHGTLDAALLKPFELITVTLGVPRKGGRPPTVVSHSSFASFPDTVGHALFFNREKHKVQLPSGKVLGPTSKSDVIQNFKFSRINEMQGSIRFDHALVFDRKAVRALFKVAYEILAFNVGADYVRRAIFEPIRSFVCGDIGYFQALLFAGEPIERMSAELDERGLGTVSFDLLGIRFMCDFDPEFRSGQNAIAVSRLQNVWPAKLPNVDQWCSRARE